MERVIYEGLMAFAGNLAGVRVRVFFMTLAVLLHVSMAWASYESRFGAAYLELGARVMNIEQAGAAVMTELNHRTQVDPLPVGSWKALGGDFESPPPFVWIIVGAHAVIDAKLVEHLQRFLASGGTVFVEPEPGVGAQEKLRDLTERVFPKERPSVVDKSDLITRTFYFLDDQAISSLKVLEQSGRLVWISSTLPVLRHVADNVGDHPERESAVRIAVNVVIYTLTGDYKNDLTHVRYLLRRRKF